jgi:deoxyadenosine/deoxycytidine kinase
MKKIFTVEGNIGSGKSTLLKKLKEQGLPFIFLQEPVDEWNKIQDNSGVTILERFYSDKRRYSFSFQMMAYITRLSQLKQCIENAPEDCIILTERSMYTDRYVFAKMLYDSGLMESIEYQIYLHWFDEFINYTLSGIIYIKTTPYVCLERTRIRNRKGEEGILIDYLESCDTYHNLFVSYMSIPVCTINGDLDINFDTILNFIR